MAGRKQGDDAKPEDYDLYEATAGWDSYVSGLLSEARDARDRQAPDPRPATAAPQEERRRAPRDRTPARRRTVLMRETGLDPRDRRSED